jgi:hypothetical protein
MTAAAAPPAVIQTSSCGKASLRRRNSMKGRQDTAAAVLVKEDPGHDRVVLEG